MPAGTSYLFKQNMLSQRMELLPDAPEHSYMFGVRNHFLHAVHPIGWIKRLDVEIDGKLCPPEKVYFVLRGQWFLSTKLETISEVFWNLSELAQVCFQSDEALASGEHHVKCTFSTSLLEDTQVLDTKNVYPLRVEYVEADMKL